MALIWFISDPANRPLPSIEGSERLAHQEMNLYYRDKVPGMQSLDWNCIGTALELDWFISDLANRPLPSIEGSERLAHQEMKLYYRDRVP